ncbi:MAG TPA: hypothetical protein VHC43_04140 [Mycobacteriales bacterium]|nr:hypothetical protein [Mycobacteriales bacterium]
MIDLMIAGGQKCATSSILEYFRAIDGVRAQTLPEMAYFTYDDEWRRGYDSAFRMYFPQRAAPADAGSRIIAKHANIMARDHALARLYEHNPRVHLLVSLREPVARAYSAYWWARREGIETMQSFEDAVAAGPRRFTQPSVASTCDYLGNGEYARQLAGLITRFSSPHVHVVFDSEYFAAPDMALGPVLGALGLTRGAGIAAPRENAAAAPRSERFARALQNARISRQIAHLILPRRVTRRIGVAVTSLNQREIDIPPISPKTAARLREHYQAHDDALRTMLGRALPWDSEAL